MEEIPTSLFPVRARLDRQNWVRDYAESVGGRPLVYDCRMALDSFALSELPPAAEDIRRGYLDHGDLLYVASVELGLVERWDGPISLSLERADYGAYLDSRVAREYEREPRDPSLPWHSPQADEVCLRRFDDLVEMDDAIYDAGDERLEAAWLLTVPDRYGMVRNDHLFDLWDMAEDDTLYGWACKAYHRLMGSPEGREER